jgi:hypothetical protein
MDNTAGFFVDEDVSGRGIAVGDYGITVTVHFIGGLAD